MQPKLSEQMTSTFAVGQRVKINPNMFGQMTTRDFIGVPVFGKPQDVWGILNNAPSTVVGCLPVKWYGGEKITIMPEKLLILA